MTSSKRPSPEPFLKKEASRPYWGGENSGNALEAPTALNYRVWGIPAVLSRGIPGNALRAFPGSFRNFSGISSGKSQPYWGCGLVGPLITAVKVYKFFTVQNLHQKKVLFHREALQGWPRQCSATHFSSSLVCDTLERSWLVDRRTCWKPQNPETIEIGQKVGQK